MIVEFISQHADLVIIAVICVMVIMFTLIAALAASSGNRDLDDEEQMQYLTEYSRRRKEGIKK